MITKISVVPGLNKSFLAIFEKQTFYWLRYEENINFRADFADNMNMYIESKGWIGDIQNIILVLQI